MYTLVSKSSLIPRLPDLFNIHQKIGGASAVYDIHAILIIRPGHVLPASSD